MASVPKVSYSSAVVTWGRVEPGYTANLVLLTADPLADISNTEKIDAVILSGKFLVRAQLDQMLRDAKVSPQ